MLTYKSIFQRAISSADKHGIKLKPGRENEGYGNCSYEAAIFNINDRSCFTEKFLMSADFYRRIWNIDILNKILCKENDWNPGLTDAQLREGFAELMKSGVYERPFFGDMMIAGIACGIRKRILIFNTNERTTHDPISVIDPAQYGGCIDDEVPVVVAYDLVHYESMHPVDNCDIDETIRLVNSYIAEPSRYAMEYGFTRNDMNYLISKESRKVKTSKENTEKNKTRKEVKDSLCGVLNEKAKDSADSDFTELKLNENSEEFVFGEVLFQNMKNGSVKCGICKTDCKRLVFHLNSSEKCRINFDMPELRTEYSKYRSRIRNRVRITKRKTEDFDAFKEKERERKKKYVDKKKTEDPDGFKDKAKESKDKHEAKKKAEDIEKFKAEAKTRQKDRQTKRKAEDSEGFKVKAKESKDKHDAKKRAEDMGKFKADATNREKERQA